MKPKRNKEEIRGRPPDEKARNNKEPPKPLSTKRLAISLLIKLAVIALAVWLVFAFVLGISINYGNNMHPAVNDGDLVISLKLQRPYLNAAVLYRHDGKTRTGRVVGLAGNVIELSENGELIGVYPQRLPGRYRRQPSFRRDRFERNRRTSYFIPSPQGFLAAKNFYKCNPVKQVQIKQA